MLASRRRFLMFAAPAIVAAPSLMRVSALIDRLAAEPKHILTVHDSVSGFIVHRAIVFNRALTRFEIAEVTQYLMAAA